MVCFLGAERGQVGFFLVVDSVSLVDAVKAFQLDMQAINILLSPQRNFTNVCVHVCECLPLQHRDTPSSYASPSPQPHKCCQNKKR